jgi:serine/threonine protein kinase
MKTKAPFDNMQPTISVKRIRLNLHSSSSSTTKSQSPELSSQVLLTQFVSKKDLNTEIAQDQYKPYCEKKAKEAIRHAIKTNSRITNDYIITACLGWGGNGTVLAAFSHQRQQMVAIKIIYRRNEQKTPSELEWLSKLRHLHILKHYEHFEDSFYFYLVTELFGEDWKEGQLSGSTVTFMDPISNDQCIRIPVTAGAKDLFAYLEREKRPSLDICRLIFVQIAQAINYMHDHHVVHGDIKEENILIGKEGRAKLCDFGHARHDGYQYQLYGTNEMCAPEIVKNIHCKPHERHRMPGKPMDIWALGLLLYTLMHGSLPPCHNAFIQGHIQYYPVTFHKRIPESVRQLIQGMLCVDPNHRLTIKQVVSHPFLM